MRTQVHTFVKTMQKWPWLDTARTLLERFREDRLGLTASSLTFTTLIALVPLITVMLAVFSTFPLFAGFQLALEKYFIQNLVPPNIAQPVLKAITQFTTKATQLGSAGLAALVVSALVLVFTIDRTLNTIWRVRRKRPLHQRMLIHWAALTLGPLLVGVSLTLMTYLLSNTTRSARTITPTAELLLHGVEFLLFALGVAALFRFVPNTQVRWRHAMAGGVFVALGLQGAKKVLAWYVAQTPLYSSVYGAFAAVPIFLLWLYMMWVIVLLGAVIAAYAPSLSMRVVRHPNTAGSRFTLALTVLQALRQARDGDSRGLSLERLAQGINIDSLMLEPVVDALIELDWVARLEEGGSQRLVLLVDASSVRLAPLVHLLLLHPSSPNDGFRERAGVDTMTLADALSPVPPGSQGRPA